MPSRGVTSALVFAATCLLDPSKAFVLVTKTSTSSNSNGNNNNNNDNNNNSNQWSKKGETSHKVPMGSNRGFGAGLWLPHIRRFGLESVVNLPRVPSALDHAEKKSRDSSCPPLHFGLHDMLADFREDGQCGGVESTQEGGVEEEKVVVVVEEEEEVVEEEVVVVEEVVVEVGEKEVVRDKKKGLLSWLRKKAKKSDIAAAEGEMVEVGEKKGPVSWLRKKVFRRTKTSAPAAGAVAAPAPAAPTARAAREHKPYVRLAVR